MCAAIFLGEIFWLMVIAGWIFHVLRKWKSWKLISCALTSNCQRRMRKIDLYFKSEKQRNGSLISKFQYGVVGRHFWKPIINYLMLERQELITQRTYFWEPLLQLCSSVVTFQRFSQTPLASFGMSGCHQSAPGSLVAWHHRTPTPQAYFLRLVNPFAMLQPDINIAIPALNSSLWFRVITYPSFPMYL